MKKQFLYFLFFVFLTACSSKKEQATDGPETVIAELKPTVITLHFNGSIEPDKKHLVTSKVDGTIKKMYFEYGLPVAKDQLLFVIESPQLVVDYQTTLTEFLKAQRDFNQSEKQLQGSTELKKLGIISEQEFQNDQSQNYNASVALMQARRKLKEILEKFDILPVSIEQLKELAKSDPSKLTDIFANSKTTTEIYSPALGITMPGEKGDSGNDKGLKENSGVKAGQILVVIGERTGVLILVKASEINIEDIPTGQEAIITGDGFPNITLKGTIFYKERLPVSSDSGGGGTPMYGLRILVPKINAEAREKIRVGMSVRVEVNITKPPTIKVPISAVNAQGDKTFVKVVDPTTNKIVNKTVSTGATLEDSVEILTGLKPGDKVVVDDNTSTSGN